MGYFDAFKPVTNVLANKYAMRRAENKENISDIFGALGQVGQGAYDLYQDKKALTNAQNMGRGYFDNEEDAKAFLSGLTGREAMEKVRELKALKDFQQREDLIRAEDRANVLEDRADQRVYDEAQDKKNFLRGLFKSSLDNKGNLVISFGNKPITDAQLGMVDNYTDIAKELSAKLGLELPENLFMTMARGGSESGPITIEDYIKEIEGLGNDWEKTAKYLENLEKSGKQEEFLKGVDYEAIRGAMRSHLKRFASDKAYENNPAVKRALEAWGVKTDQEYKNEGKAKDDAAKRDARQKAYKAVFDDAMYVYNNGGKPPNIRKQQLKQFINDNSREVAEVIWGKDEVARILGEK